MIETLRDLLVATADAHLQIVHENGSVPPGNNGLYDDPETPVRNAAHWAVLFSTTYEETGDERFRDAVERIAGYLCSEEARPGGASFNCRESAGKDHCNGVIGQAWAIEGLTAAARTLEEPSIATIAEEVFLLHPQDERTGLWKRVEVDGRVLPYDATFDHQIWFAAAGGLLADLPWTDEEVDRRVRRHLDEVEHNCSLHSSGPFYHLFKPATLGRYARLIRSDTYFRIGVTFARNALSTPTRRRKLHRKSVGYHAFILYAFGLLKRSYPYHEFWRSDLCRRALAYARSDVYRDVIWSNGFGPPYNPAGFEVPLALEAFDLGTADERAYWVREQLNRHYVYETNRMAENTTDERTLTARLYEAARLEDVRLDNATTTG